MQTLLGIDEAGRGCVIGPLVVAGVLVGEEQREALIELGVRDSKRLSRGARERLFSQIHAVAHRVFCIEIAPGELAENLTHLELRAFCQIIGESGADRVVLDLPVGPGAQRSFIQAVRQQTAPRDFELIAENGADGRYPVVGAASIVAKVHRDRAIEKLREQYGDFGWGYPAEPKTRAFLAEYFVRTGRFPECARAKWRTLKAISELKKTPPLPLPGGE
jgi:ribonuclease HII